LHPLAKQVNFMFQGYYPPGLMGCYPATVTIEQIHTGNRNIVQRSIPRWTAFAALEEVHGLHLLPDEPRARAYGLAVSTECSLHHSLRQQCRGEEPHHRLVDPASYMPVLSAYLSEARLAFLLSDIRRIAKEAAHRRLTFIDRLTVRHDA
jgi:hypothetical protein